MTQKKKICVVTASRSEYGLLKWIMHDLKKNEHFQLQTVVTGTHLSEFHGFTLREIEADGFNIDFQFDMLSENDSPKDIVLSMARCSKGMAEAFDLLNPDMVMVLGDRYELLPICSAALMMQIPIIHLSGGDITEGAIDDSVRHAVTKMASLHFPGTQESAQRIISMGEEPHRVIAVGEPGLEAILKTNFLSRTELSEQIGMDRAKKWAILTYHPETQISENENIKAVNNLINSISAVPGMQTMITAANSDSGGNKINDILKEAAKRDNNIFFKESLGQLIFLSLLKESAIVAGNSSSGIVEAPTFKIPVLNIGDRQKGRPQAENIINATNEANSINAGLNKALNLKFNKEIINPFGDGNTSQKIIKHLEGANPVSLISKKFYQL